MNVLQKAANNFKNALISERLDIPDLFKMKYFCIETIWAESALKAPADMKRNDLRLIFNSDLFLVKNILRNVEKFKYFISETFIYLKDNKKGVTIIFKLTILLFYFILKYLLNTFMIARKTSKDSMTFTDEINIEAATILATKALNEKKIVYDVCQQTKS